MSASTWQSRIRVSALKPGVVEVVCTGRIESEDGAYLQDLKTVMEKQAGAVGLLFDGTALTGFHPLFARGHIDFFKAFSSRIQRIAVAHNLSAVRFAIATVSLASAASIKSFDTRDAALSWLSEA